jgi:hypothetical protein
LYKKKKNIQGSDKMKLELEFNKDLHWYSDWNGYEVGHDDVDVVGYYALAGTDVSFFIDMDKMKILEAFCECLDE